jgi:hypothetical protein
MLNDDDLIHALRAELQDVRPPEDLLDRLRAGAHVDGDQSPRRQRRRHLTPSAVISVVATAVAVAVAVVFVASLRHPSSTRPAATHHHLSGPASASATAAGPPPFLHLSGPDHRVIDYVMKAEGATDRAHPACAMSATTRAPGDKPNLSSGTPGTGLLSILGVLGRPQGASDQLPPRKIWDGPHSTPRVYQYGTYPPADGIYASYIRKVRSRFGANYYLVPAANVNQDQPQPARCYREQQAALRQELGTIPPRLRGAALALQPRYLAYEKRLAIPYPGVCLVAVNGSGNGDGASCGYSVGEIKAGHTLTSGAPSGVGVVYGLAPDGVRSVTLQYSKRPDRHTFTVPVINNVFIVPNPHQRLPHEGFPDKLLWRSSDGQIIKTISWR